MMLFLLALGLLEAGLLNLKFPLYPEKTAFQTSLKQSHSPVP